MGKLMTSEEMDKDTYILKMGINTSDSFKRDK